jgi:ABC-type dipeptide/oligopeptide/nickel transport system permease component
MGLLGYVLRRILLLIPVILGVTFITFFISRVVIPDPARAWAGPHASAQQLANLIARYHLSSPLYVQYFIYMRDLIVGNWGTSPISDRPILTEVRLFFPATLELALVSIFFAIIIGIPLGIVAAVRQNRKADHIIRLFYLTGFATPPFFMALVILFVFGYKLGFLPTQGQLTQSLVPPHTITGMYILDSLLTGNSKDFFDALAHIILPAAALTFTYVGLIIRVTRSSMLEVLQKDFIRSAYAMGLRNRVVVYRHALRNALISTTTIIGLLLGSLLGGTVVVETIFLWPGIGYYAVQAISSFNFPAIMGVTLIFTLGVVLANLIADIVYAFLNPQIKL